MAMLKPCLAGALYLPEIKASNAYAPSGGGAHRD